MKSIISALVRLLNAPAFILLVVALWLASAPVSANSFEPKAEALALVDVGLPPDSTIGQPAPKAKDDYAVAYESAQLCGKLCIFIGMDGCRHCPGALRVFQESAVQSNGACIALDLAKDKAYVDDIVRDHGKGRACPQVVVYSKAGDGWSIDTVIGNEPEKIRAAMTGKSEPAATQAKAVSYHHEVSCDKCVGCKSCPADCAANGCHCHGSAGAHAAGACCGGGLVLGQPVRNVGRVILGTAKFFQEHKPVRKLAGRIVYRVTHPFNGRFRCR